MPNWYVEVLADEGLRADLALLAPELKLEEVPESWAGPSRNRLSIPRDDAAGANPLEVRERVRPLLEDLNRRIADDGSLHQPLMLGSGIWQPRPDLPGGFSRSAVEELVGVAMKTALGVMVAAVGGRVVTPPRTQGLRQKELAGINLDFARAVDQFYRAGEDIPKLYVSFEYVKKRSGRFKSLPGAAEAIRFAKAANKEPDVRHIGEEGFEPMSGKEARAIVRRLLVDWLDAANPP